jgi:glycosyltransferase involved in cell wall biosynthesis
MTADAVGGVWSYAMDLSAALAAHDVQVTIAVLGPPPTEAQAAAARRNVTLVTYPCKLEWMDDPWDDVAASGKWLLDLEAQVRPDAVHLNGYCHAHLPWRAPVLVVAHSCVCSWWRAVHGVDGPAALERYRRDVAAGLARAHMVVAPTAAMLAALEREYDVLPSTRVIPNGRLPVPSSQWPGPSFLETGNRKLETASGHLKQPFVFTAGRIWDEAKNIASVCAVAGCISWPLYVAGDAREPGGRQTDIGYARYLGRLEPADMDSWYARASIYALPARYEPFGLSVLEAASAGCALVLGDIRSLRENWSGAAMFVAPDNRRALSGAIERLINKDDQRAALASQAAARAGSFNAARMAEQYSAVYDQLMAGRLARAS